MDIHCSKYLQLICAERRSNTSLPNQLYEPSREKTNIVDSALSIDPDQPKHAAQDNPDRHFLPPVDCLFQESLLYTFIPRRSNVSARISLRGLRRLFWVDSLRRVHNVGCLVDGSYVHVIY